MRREFVALFFLSALAVRAFAAEMQQIPSPNHSKVLLVDTSGKEETLSIKSGSKIIRLFYGHFGDALDAWKPGLSKLYGIPESRIGKIVLPHFVAAKWISENEVQVDLESTFFETESDNYFEFSVRALVSGNGKTLRTTFQVAGSPPEIQGTSSAGTPERSADNAETEGAKEANSATVVDPDGWTNLRTDAGTESKIKGRVTAGTEVGIISKVGKWYLVKTPSGLTGFIHGSRLFDPIGHKMLAPNAKQ